MNSRPRNASNSVPQIHPRRMADLTVVEDFQYSLENSSRSSGVNSNEMEIKDHFHSGIYHAPLQPKKF